MEMVTGNLQITPELAKKERDELIKKAKSSKDKIQIKLAEKFEEVEKNKENRIKSFLQEERRKYESLGCGFHDGVYYFGTKLFKENRSYTALITSNQKFYLILQDNNEIRHQFGLNYKDDFYDEGLDSIFSKEAINKWIYENSEDITIKSI